MSFGIGDIIALASLLWKCVRRGHFRLGFATIRYVLQRTRSRKQSRFIHRSVAHQIRDFASFCQEQTGETFARFDDLRANVIKALADLESAQRGAEQQPAVPQSKIAKKTSRQAAQKLRKATSRAISAIDDLSRFTEHLDFDRDEVRRELDTCLENACTGVADLLRQWTVGTCSVAILTLVSASAVRESLLFRKWRAAFTASSQPILGLIETSTDDTVVACVRCRDALSKPSASRNAPWRIVEETTALRALLEGQSERGASIFICHDTSDAAYKDSSLDKNDCASLAVLPLQGSRLQRPAAWGFLWIASSKNNALRHLLRPNVREESWSGPLHLFHAVADTCVCGFIAERATLDALDALTREAKTMLQSIPSSVLSEVHPI